MGFSLSKATSLADLSPVMEVTDLSVVGIYGIFVISSHIVKNCIFLPFNSFLGCNHDNIAKFYMNCIGH